MMNTLPPPLAPAPPRFHALDAARGIALLLGVVFHGLESLTFAKTFGPAQDTQGSVLLEAAYYSLHVFRMQAFFLLAGFFAHLLYHRRGAGPFVANRTKRLVLPLLLFWPLNYGLVAALWAWSIHRASGLPAAQAFARLPALYRLQGGVPLLHLWFLYYLILLCAGVVLLRPAVARWADPAGGLRRGADGALAWAMGRWWGSPVLALATVGPMLRMASGFGVDTPESTLWPQWPVLALYGLYFGWGWFLHRQPRLLDGLRRFRAASLGLGVAFIGALFVLKLRYDFNDPAVAHWLPPAMNALYAFASMAWVWTFVGYTLTFFSAPHPLVRYLSDSAYWGYLVHLPVVILFQILVAPYGWPWPAKLALILGPSFLVVMLSYRLAVRNTWLGLLLNGRTHRP